MFKYRVYRTCRVVEKVFRIASSVFCMLRKPMPFEPEKASLVVLTVTLLHNVLCLQYNSTELYTPVRTFDSEEAGVVNNGS